MPSVLISGPAGTGKTKLALATLGTTGRNAILADFTAVFNAVTGTRRDPATGRFPIRRGPEQAFLPITERLRQDVIRRGREMGFDIVATNSDGSPARRRRLLELLGPGSKEIVLDPGEETVVDRLKAKETGILDPECGKAIGRWYTRLR